MSVWAAAESLDLTRGMVSPQHVGCHSRRFFESLTWFDHLLGKPFYRTRLADTCLKGTGSDWGRAFATFGGGSNTGRALAGWIMFAEFATYDLGSGAAGGDQVNT
jgi:hypothetical protein